MTGLNAVIQGGPAGLSEQLTLSPTLSGAGQTSLAYTLMVAGAATAQSVPIDVHVTSAEGAVLDIPINLTVSPSAAQLIANPAALNAGMVVGAQSIISFQVSNVGGAPTGDLEIALPPTSFMSLASPSSISSLAPGASATVNLLLSPAATAALTQYTGTIVLSSESTDLSIPFDFRAVSTAVGDVHVLVDDEYTFASPTATPRVADATVSLLDPYNNSNVIATGTTDSNGAITLPAVPAGQYLLQVQAAGHGIYQASYTVAPGITNDQEIFISQQFVTYTFSVTPTNIQDSFQIALTTTFQTDVPAPVVTISAPDALPSLQPGATGSFNITLTNHGLIAAQDVQIQLPTSDNFTLTALQSVLGTIPANSSVTVPINVTRKILPTTGGWKGTLTAGNSTAIAVRHGLRSAHHAGADAACSNIGHYRQQRQF